MNFTPDQKFYSSRDIKMEARGLLQGNWKGAALLSLIPSLFTIFFLSGTNADIAGVTSQVDLVNLLLRAIQGFLATGVSFTFLDFIRNRQPIEPLRGVVQAFQSKYLVNLLLLKVLKNVYIFLWTLLLVIPGLVKGYGYSQAERIFKDKVDQEGIVPSPSACLRESQQLMYGHKLDLFTLDLSFIGWVIASVFSFGIGFIWLTPYMEVSQAIFYQNLLGNDPASAASQRMTEPTQPMAEVGKDPDDFSDFEDF